MFPTVVISFPYLETELDALRQTESSAAKTLIAAGADLEAVSCSRPRNGGRPLYGRKPVKGAKLGKVCYNLSSP